MKINTKLQIGLAVDKIKLFQHNLFRFFNILRNGSGYTICNVYVRSTSGMRIIKSYISYKANPNKFSSKNFTSGTELKCQDDGTYDQDERFILHNPGENYKSKNYIITQNTHRLLEEHLKITGGQVRTRFSPEPNGLLHAGHAKAINLSFGYAKMKNGICFLRFDDTNPDTEDETYINSIQDMVKWLGYTPYKVTYASDYFDQLYEWGRKLIHKDLAFVCHLPPKLVDYNTEVSPWRNRPVEESLNAFEEMKNKKYGEGEATLRLKMTTEQNTVDPVAYRIKYVPHHRTKDKWCVYPTYDFAHGLCDSIEHITHSFCSAEFTLRRSTYYWICNAVDVYCPVQTEFGRLNFLYAVMSKRKTAQLLKTGHIKGWDDPRLFTLAALKRRGIPAAAINSFCENFGFNQESAFIDPEHLFFYVREILNNSARRVMGVLEPLKVVITNYPYPEPIHLEVPNFSNDRSRGVRTVTFDKEVWIEKADFKEVDEKGYRRLTPTQGVGLKHSGYIIVLQDIVRRSDGQVDQLHVTCIPKGKAKQPKAFIHWVSHPVEAEIRIYEHLFYHERPEDLDTVPSGFLSDVNPNSLQVTSALVEQSLRGSNPYDQLQLERVSYFSVDPDSTPDRLVLNKIVDLKQKKGFKDVDLS